LEGEGNKKEKKETRGGCIGVSKQAHVPMAGEFTCYQWQIRPRRYRAHTLVLHAVLNSRSAGLPTRSSPRLLEGLLVTCLLTSPGPNEGSRAARASMNMASGRAGCDTADGDEEHPLSN